MHISEDLQKKEEQCLQQFRENFVDNKLAKYHVNELNRADLISVGIYSLLAFGWIDYAKQYAQHGLELLDIAKKKRQKRLLVDTVVPRKYFNYHINRLRHLFRWILEEQEPKELIQAMYEELTTAYTDILNVRASSRTAGILVNLCDVSIKHGDIATANKYAARVRELLKLPNKTDYDISVHDWCLIEKATGVLMLEKEKRGQGEKEIHRYYEQFYKNLREIPPKGLHRPADIPRPLNILTNTSYLYYKYFRPDIGPNPNLVLQSTIYGFITKPVRKTEKKPKS